MHRTGIASVQGNRIVLNGTTIQEVEQVHLPTLKYAVNAANSDRQVMAQREQAQRKQAAEQRRAQEQAAREAASRLNFD